MSQVALPMAAAPNVKGLWFDDTDWLACNDMCNEVHGMHLSPCDMAAKERLFNGTVAWKTAVAQKLNSNGQVPIFSSINRWNSTPSQQSCPRNEQQVTREMAGLSYGRFYEGWSGTCDAILQAQKEAAAGIAVFVDHYTTAPLDEYTVAAFLVSAGDQSFLAVQSSWTGVSVCLLVSLSVSLAVFVRLGSLSLSFSLFISHARWRDRPRYGLAH